MGYFHQTSLKLKLVEAKILIDRWDNVAADIIFHSSQKNFIEEKLIVEIVQIWGGRQIWGMNIYYSDNCPTDKGIMIDPRSDADTENARHISVFPM